MGDTTVKEAISQQAEATEQCCEPECGPTTCGPTQAPVVLMDKPRTAAEQCCEPECGPETCGC